MDWCDRVAAYLGNSKMAVDASVIGMHVRRDKPACGVRRALRNDVRFVEDDETGFFRLRGTPEEEAALAAAKAAAKAAAEAAEAKRARRREAARKRYEAKKSAAKKVPFIPAKTDYRAPDVCFEAVLNNEAAAAVLQAWSWMLILPQVSRGFRACFEPTRWIHLACAKDTARMIWKAKAMQLFFLTRDEVGGIPYCVKKFGYNKEVHLLNRRDVLRVAMQKYKDDVITEVRGKFQQSRKRRREA